MRHPHVKICGLKTVDALDAVLARGGPEVGFVHFARSPRHLELDDIAALVRHVDGRALCTVVTVDPDDALLDEIARRVAPDTVQLHGSESVERVAAIARRTGARVMKAISIRDAGDLADVTDYADVAHRLLLDAKAPAGAQLPGGNGHVFDWTLLAALGGRVDYMLSGGLTPLNVEAALTLLEPFGLDISSGVEASPGVKDDRLINGFFDAVERALRTDERKQAS